jgi:hypothetical protein
MQQIGIDVASLDDFVALLPSQDSASGGLHLKGTGCAVSATTMDAVRQYLDAPGVGPSTFGGVRP